MFQILQRLRNQKLIFPLQRGLIVAQLPEDLSIYQHISALLVDHHMLRPNSPVRQLVVVQKVDCAD
jgi:hypothetical protein